MLTGFIISLFLVTLYFNRYVPVRNVPAVKGNDNDAVFVDLRDYQDSAKNPVNGAINIPCGYLKRYIKEIPNQEIVIIASDEVEKNFGARLLKKYGYNVKGYTITGPSQ
ncbi:sulfurtransferase [Mesobacillus subterraneus]|uniref:sulfurtransferase n=1 Tax=Mesobacillus subterraneus TaxID=285983 RepID=UPI00203DAB48|nr:sulfurtransferase [Mesobacillus subterraneus]MCM3664333.1 sulfurtransferase [Mesobacillus subterraneus]MCM3682360.1 sulfurtransferase [Mesobacillus subterraneus]